MPRIAGALLITALLIVAIRTHAADSASKSTWAPSGKLISKIESTIQLPAGADAVSTYTRYYVGITGSDGRRVVRAVFAGSGARVVALNDESKLPRILDGGCGVIDLEYDVETHRLVFATCHGEA
jgi:hypothetical protein